MRWLSVGSRRGVQCRPAEIGGHGVDHRAEVRVRRGKRRQALAQRLEVQHRAPGQEGNAASGADVADELPRLVGEAGG